MSNRTVVEELRQGLGRKFEIKGLWIVQTCPVCEIELRLLEMSVDNDNLETELFSLFDDHRCRTAGTEVMFERAERESVLRGERALALADQGDGELAERAEKESIRLARWVEAYLKSAA